MGSLRACCVDVHGEDMVDSIHMPVVRRGAGQVDGRIIDSAFEPAACRLGTSYLPDLRTRTSRVLQHNLQVHQILVVESFPL